MAELKRISRCLSGLVCVVFLAPFTQGQEPANDLLAHAVTLGGAEVEVAGTTVGASREPSEPLLASDAAGHTVWYSWTAPENGTINILVADADGSIPYSFRFSLETGDEISSLAFLSGNQVFGISYPQIFTNVLAGQTYRIAVDSATNLVEKPFRLRLSFITAPANDSFADRSELTGFMPTAIGTTSGAAAEPGESLLDTTTLHQTVWWSWTAPDDGVVFLSMTGSCPGQACAPAMAVFIGELLPTLSLVATNDGPLFNLNPTIRFDVVRGTRYQIRAADAPSPVVGLTLDFHDLRILSPTNDSTIETGQDVTLRLSDLPDRLVGQLHHVDFVGVNSVLIGSVDGPPFEYTLKNALPGEHLVGVIANDFEGSSVAIPGVRFFVTTAAGAASLKIDSADRRGGMVSVTGTYGTHFMVERSTDLIQWASFAESWLLDQPAVFPDPGPAGPGNIIIDPNGYIPSVFFRLKIGK